MEENFSRAKRILEECMLSSLQDEFKNGVICGYSYNGEQPDLERASRDLGFEHRTYNLSNIPEKYKYLLLAKNFPEGIRQTDTTGEYIECYVIIFEPMFRD